MNLEFGLGFGLLTLDFFYGLEMTQGYPLDHSLSLRLLKPSFDNVLLEHGGLHVYPLVDNQILGTFWVSDFGLGLVNLKFSTT